MPAGRRELPNVVMRYRSKQPGSAPGTYQLTYRCQLCGKPAIVTVPAERFDDWYGNTAAPMVQNQFPDLTAADREILLSGTHDECFNKAFSDEEPER
jgi:hypothetical protein